MRQNIAGNPPTRVAFLSVKVFSIIIIMSFHILLSFPSPLLPLPRRPFPQLRVCLFHTWQLVSLTDTNLQLSQLRHRTPPGRHWMFWFPAKVECSACFYMEVKWSWKPGAARHQTARRSGFAVLTCGPVGTSLVGTGSGSLSCSWRLSSAFPWSCVFDCFSFTSFLLSLY